MRAGNGFSGVMDTETGALLIRPSGDSVHADGRPARDRVSQYGGHGQLRREFQEHVDPEAGRRMVGFTLIPNEQTGAWRINWNSISVNERTWGSRAAPREFRNDILQALQEAAPSERFAPDP